MSINYQNDDFSNRKVDLVLTNAKLQTLRLIELIKILMPENSNSQIKTLISQNAIKINGEIISDLNFNLTSECFENSENRLLCFVEVGKRIKFLIEYCMDS